MRVAFYKGTRKGFSGLYNRGVRWIDRSSYSHCELIFSDGLSASASFTDGGVRFKQIDYDPSKWDIIDISWVDEKSAREYFERNDGLKYDIMGNIRFLCGIVRDSENKFFCSEAVAGAIGLTNPWRFTPSALYEILVYINRIKQNESM